MIIIVTGASGFIGTYLCELLRAFNFEVIEIDKNVGRSNGRLIQHDLTFPLYEKINADLCIHLAASVGGILFNNNNAGFVEYNNQINSNVYNLCFNNKITKLIYFSSINVFESQKYFKHSKLEIDPIITPYAISKCKGELFFADRFSDLIVIRPTNVFGKNQLKTHNLIGESHVIPDLLHKLKNSSSLELLGDGNQIRNFIHVLDICKFVKSNLSFTGQHYLNLRSEILISIRELALELMKFSGYTRPIVYKPEFLKFENFSIVNFDIEYLKNFHFDNQIMTIVDGLLI